MLVVPRVKFAIVPLLLASAVTVAIGAAMKKTRHIPSPAVFLGPSMGCRIDALFYFLGTTGIGLDLSGKEEYPVVSRIGADTPAEKCGIKVGESILEIDGRDTRLMTASEMYKKMAGEKWTPISLKLQNALGCSRTVSFLRARVADVPHDEEKWAAHACWANQTYIGGAPNEHNIEVPYFLYHERMKSEGPVAIEFYSSRRGPCKVAPEVYVKSIRGLGQGISCGFGFCRSFVTYPPNPVIDLKKGTTMRYCIDVPLYREVASRLGITVPATLFWLHDQPMIYESRIVKDSISAEPRFLEGPMDPQPGDSLYNSCGYYGVPAHN